MKPSLTQIGLVATLLAATAKANASNFTNRVVTSVAADLLIGGGYISSPLGIALEVGNGSLTKADRTSALYAGGRVTTDFLTPSLGAYFIEVGTFGGTSEGSFRDLSALFGPGQPGETSERKDLPYTLKETLFQAYVGRVLAMDSLAQLNAIGADSPPDWQVQARIGFTSIDGTLRAKKDYKGPNDVLIVSHGQDAQDWLGNVGLRAEIDVWRRARRLFRSVGIGNLSQARIVLDGEISGGVRNARVSEEIDLGNEFDSGEKSIRQDVVTYGGVGRVTLLTEFELAKEWSVVLNLGLQSRYMWIHWDGVKSYSETSTASISNVRGNELLWGPYFQVGIQHQW